MSGIVVGVDGSENSVSALRWAAGQAEVRNTALRVVFVWEFPYMDVVPPTLGATLPPYSEMQEAAEKQLDEIIAKAHLSPGCKVERVVAEGAVVRILLDQAKDADLLVVGARGRGGFLGLLTGSVATQLVNHSTVPTVVVRA
jgi:nucleotide-binding universal stress UspA family protein